MPQGTQTWRELLGSLSGEEKREITVALGIQSKTLERWIRGYTDLPRPNTLRRLITLLSTEQRARFITLIRQDPHLAQYVDDLLLPDIKKGIPSLFYAWVLEANVLTPDHWRFTTICQLVLLQTVGQLDPNHLGLSITILKCTPPLQGKNVRTLSQQFSLSSPPWNTVIEQKGFFLGAESIAGQAVMTGSPFVVQDTHNASDPRIRSLYWDEFTRSTVAVPLQRAGCIAGCLLVLSTQPYFFIPSLLTLIQHYCHLLVIALHDHELYERQHIDLQLVPALQMQHEYLAHFRDRVSSVIRQAQRDGQSKHWLQADQEVRQQIEAELLEKTCAQQ